MSFIDRMIQNLRSQIPEDGIFLSFPGRMMTKKNKQIKSRYTGKKINPASKFEGSVRDHAYYQIITESNHPQRFALRTGHPLFPDERLYLLIIAYYKHSLDDRTIPDTLNAPDALLDALQEKRTLRGRNLIRTGILYTDDRQVDGMTIARFGNHPDGDKFELYAWEIQK